MTKAIKVPSLNGDKIQEQYPLSFEAFGKWIGTFPNQEAISDRTDEHLYNNALKSILYFNPRALYEFFDEAGIRMVPDHNEPFGAKPQWRYHIYTDHEGLYSNNGNSRIETEEMGFQKCFDLLEKRLKG